MPTSTEILFDASSVKEVQAQILGLIPVFDRVAKASKNLFAQSAKDATTAEAAAAKEIGKQADIAGKAKIKAATDAAREQERIAKDAQRAELNFIRAGQKAIESAEKEKTRAVDRESRERQRIAEREAREIEATITRRSRAFGNLMGGATGRVMGMAGRIAGVATAIGGGFAVADALRTGIDEERLAGTVSRNAVTTGGLTQKNVIENARATAIRTGATSIDVLGGLDAMVRKTGDLKGAVDMLDQLSKLSSITGASMADMGSAAAEAFNQLGNARDTERVMLALAGQSRAGAIDIRDLAQYGARLTALSKTFEGGAVENIESFGALAQIAKSRGGATDAAEATEAVVALFGEMATHQEDFASLGVKLRGKGGKLRNIEDILTESVIKSKGDVLNLEQLFGRRAVKGVLGLATAFNEAGGGKTGEAAMRAMLGQRTAANPEGFKTALSGEEATQLHAERMKEVSAKINVAMTEFNKTIDDRLLPIMPRLIEQFTQLIPHIERFLKFIVDEPWKGLGVLVGAALVAEIGKAALSTAVSSVFSSLAEKFLKLFSNTNAAVANVSAGVVNVTGVAPGEVGKKVVEDIAKTGGGAAGGAGALGGITAPVAAGALGIGAVALAHVPAAIAVGAILNDMNKKSEAGTSLADRLLGESAGTPEEKQAKLGRLQGLISRIEASQESISAPVGGDPTMRGARVANIHDMEAEGAAKRLAELKQQAEELKSTMGTLNETAQMFNDSLKNGGERRDVPQGYHTNPPY